MGTAVGLLVVVWLATFGSFDLLRWNRLSDFYDAQAHSWLDGTWEIGIDTLGLEAFLVLDDDAQAFVRDEWRSSIDLLGVEEFFRSQPAHMYQGPVPALFRLPVAALTDDLDGRLTAISLIVAVAVSGWLAGCLTWEVRHLIRPGRAMAAPEMALVGGFSFAVTAGSILSYLTASPWVYHEALAWGVALCLASLAALFRYVRTPTWWRLTIVGVLVVATLMTRASIGAGMLVAVVLLGVVLTASALARRWQGSAPLSAISRLGPAVSNPIGHLAGCVAIVASSLVTYALVNLARFGSLFSIRFDWQYFALADPDRAAFFERNGGFFAPEFIPTTITNYLRPDGVRFTRLFPWVDFPPAPGPIVGGVQFDHLGRTASIPAAMLVFVCLGLVGAVIVLRRPTVRRALRPATIPLIGAVASALTILPFGYIANRYLADVAPVLVLVGAIGIQALLLVIDGSDRRLVAPVWGVLGALALFGVWVNVGHGLLVQRVYSAVSVEQATAQLVAWRDAADRLLGDGSALPSRLRTGETLPEANAGDLAVIGDCDALYLHAGGSTDALWGSSWVPVERTIEGGRRPLRVVFDHSPPGTRVPLASVQGDAGPTLLVAETTAGGDLLFEFRSPTFATRGAPFAVERGTPIDLVLVADPRLRTLSVTIDGEVVFETYLDETEPLVLGRDVTVGEVAGGPMSGPVAPRFAGTIEELPGSTASLCRELVGRADGTD